MRADKRKVVLVGTGMVGMGYPDEEREAAKRQDDLVTYLN